MIHILICDDQTIVSEGLKVILGTDPDLEVVGIANDGAEALDLVPQTNPDLILMDLKMPVMNGIQATRQILAKYPHIKILVLITYDADEWVFDAIRSGAAGYLLKDAPREELLAAIKGTMAGQTHVDPAVAGKLFSHVNRSAVPVATAIAGSLTPRERDVLRLLARGLNNTDIAEQLYLSEGTVRNYVSAIFDKLGVSDRTQAAVMALRYGLADLNES